MCRSASSKRQTSLPMTTPNGRQARLLRNCVRSAIFIVTVRVEDPADKTSSCWPSDILPRQTGKAESDEEISTG